jgi:hypothetical protein
MVGRSNLCMNHNKTDGPPRKKYGEREPNEQTHFPRFAASP